MTDASEVYWYGKAFRWFFAMLDKIVYGLISFLTDIFELIAGAEIRTGDVISNFFTKIQLILGIIVLFKIVISLFSGIVDPDGLNDQKKGMGSVIKRVVVVLVMLLLIVPLNIPEEDTASLEPDVLNSQKTWNKRMNDSGILFGTMGELQSRIIKGDVIKKIVLSNGEIDTTEDISLILLKSFVFVNLKPGMDDPTDENNWMCPKDIWENDDVDDERAESAVKSIVEGDNSRICLSQGVLTEKDLEELTALGYTTFEHDGDKCVVLPTATKIVNENARENILNSINAKCDKDKEATATENNDNSNDLVPTAMGAVESLINSISVDKLGGERYIFVYKFFLSTIVGVLCLGLILSLTVETAVRVFKLLLLRLIAPIAILSYIDPKSEKTFNNWLKILGSTYLDLFIRIAIISFVVLFVTIVPNIRFDLYTSGYSATTITFARLLLYVGLFIFAKEAPKFISETLGIDRKDGKGVFSGVGKIGKLAAQGLGVGALGLGAISSFQANRRASALADEANGVNPQHWWTKLGNRGKHIASGIGGALGGTASGVRTLATSKDHYYRNVRQGNRQRNEAQLSNARNGGTFFGALRSSAGEVFRGENAYNSLEAELKAEEQQIKNEQTALKTRQDALKTRQDALKTSKNNNSHRKIAMDRANAKAIDSDKTIGTYKGITANYREYHSALEAAINHGTGVKTRYVDANGNSITKSAFEGLSADQQARYREESWFELGNGQKVNMAEAYDIDQGLKDANAANYFEEAYLYHSTNGRRGFEDATISGELANYMIDTGQSMEATFSGLKTAFGANNTYNSQLESAIARESEQLSTEGQMLSDRYQNVSERRQNEVPRSQSNSNRFKNNGQS